jgi:hypothetical protein
LEELEEAQRHSGFHPACIQTTREHRHSALYVLSQLKRIVSGESFRLSGLSLPVTIPAGHSVPFTVTSVPGAGNSLSAVLSFASDAENSCAEQAVTVRMVRPAQHKVQLTWKASTSK